MLIGKTLGKHRIIEHLGSGGMSDVYKAYQPGLDRYIAIKVLHPFLARQEDFLNRFQREAKVVAMLRHPNVIQVYDFDYDEDDDAYYMVMEFIDGPTLKDRLKDCADAHTLLPYVESANIGVAVANALDYAHQRGMVHRDVKPGNIMFGQDDQAILTDFGIAKIVNLSELTATGTMVGTPAYVSPEQGLGQTGDERSDIYSLGVVLYQMVTGQLPFEAETFMGVVLKHINEAPPAPSLMNPEVRPALVAVILKAMAKDPKERYQTAGQLAIELRQSIASMPEPGETEDAVPEPAAERTMITAAPQEWAMATMLSGPAGAGQENKVADSGESAENDTSGTIRRWAPFAIGILLIVMIAGAAMMLSPELKNRLLGALSIPQRGSSLPLAAEEAATTIISPIPKVIRVTATPNNVATEVAQALSTFAALATETPLPTETPSPTPTSTPNRTATALAACVPKAEIVEEGTVGPTILTPGQEFVRTWEMRNTGDCSWPTDVDVVRVSGSEVEIVEQTRVLPLGPGKSMTLAIAYTAPEDYGTYESTWQLKAPGSGPFGEKFVVTWEVGPAPTPLPRPTATPTATPTPEMTPTPSEPFHINISSPNAFADELDGTWHAEIYVQAYGGAGEYKYYTNGVDPAYEFDGPVYIIAGQKCLPWVGTFIVVSGDEQIAEKRFYNYPGTGCP